MASLDWKAHLESARGRLQALPRWVWAVVAGSVLGALLLLALVTRGPGYAPLYEGLSARQGGQVIDKLQKLGIPYQLNATGSIIQVPTPDLARARLKLGQMGLPGSEGSQAYNKLVAGSMTASAAAESALSRRALENRLTRAINGINGISDARVTLALPKSTPFLKQQPHPKASVWLHLGPNGLSSSQAQAVAQMVANSVPGLALKRVTVTDQNGNVLAPVPHSGLQKAQQQLRFTSLVEDRTRRHIASLLAPLIGAKNMRVSTAAAIDFSQINARSVQYGPKSQVGHLKHDNHRENGAGAGQQPVPGALSNQPPGNAAAPLQSAGGKQADATTRNNGQTNNESRDKTGNQTGPKAAQAPESQSSDNKWDVQYEVDKATTVAHRPPWQLNGLSVSVVLNQQALSQDSAIAAKIKQIISHAIAAPHLNVNVAVVPFGLQQTAPAPGAAWRSYANDPSLMQAIMELLAALLFVFGLSRPLSRWIRDRLPVPTRPIRARRSSGETEEGSDSASRAAREKHVDRARQMARERPKEAAELLRRWIKEQPNEGGAGDTP